MRCPQCGNYLSKHASACDCGWEHGSSPRTDSARKVLAHQLAAEDMAHERLRVANYECRRFGLCPQAPEESDESFIARIDREKTPLVVLR